MAWGWNLDAASELRVGVRRTCIGEEQGQQLTEVLVGVKQEVGTEGNMTRASVGFPLCFGFPWFYLSRETLRVMKVKFHATLKKFGMAKTIYF